MPRWRCAAFAGGDEASIPTCIVYTQSGSKTMGCASDHAMNNGRYMLTCGICCGRSKGLGSRRHASHERTERGSSGVQHLLERGRKLNVAIFESLEQNVELRFERPERVLQHGSGCGQRSTVPDAQAGWEEARHEKGRCEEQTSRQGRQGAESRENAQRHPRPRHLAPHPHDTPGRRADCPGRPVGRASFAGDKRGRQESAQDGKRRRLAQTAALPHHAADQRGSSRLDQHQGRHARQTLTQHGSALRSAEPACACAAACVPRRAAPEVLDAPAETSSAALARTQHLPGGQQALDANGQHECRGGHRRRRGGERALARRDVEQHCTRLAIT